MYSIILGGVSILFGGYLFFWGVSIFFWGGGGMGSFVSVHFIWGVLYFWEGCPLDRDSLIFGGVGHFMGVVFLLAWGMV